VQFHESGNDANVAMVVEIPFSVTDRIKVRSSPMLDEYLAAKDRTDRPLKITMPSPTLVAAFWNKELSTAAYRDPFELFADAAELLRGWAQELFEAGCPYVQVDAPEFNEVYADERIRAEYIDRGIDPERFKTEGAELLGRLGSVPRPDGAVLGLHVCKGNGTQSYIARGGYEDISREVRRTWSICLRRTLGKLVTDAELRRLALSSATRSRDFLLSLPRLMLALRTGAMRYGLFVWEKPQSPGGT
jgi:methionine synthase II (cobalamin-independent)